MLIKDIIKDLPLGIKYEGAVFELALGHMKRGMVLSYDLVDVEADSPHLETFQVVGSWYNPIEHYNLNAWLIISNQFEDEYEMEEAIEDFKERFKNIIH